MGHLQTTSHNDNEVFLCGRCMQLMNSDVIIYVMLSRDSVCLYTSLCLPVCLSVFVHRVHGQMFEVCCPRLPCLVYTLVCFCSIVSADVSLLEIIVTWPYLLVICTIHNVFEYHSVLYNMSKFLCLSRDVVVIDSFHMKHCSVYFVL